MANYRSSEGKSIHVPYKGKVETTVLDLLGGLRSACTYVGASKLKELTKVIDPSQRASSAVDSHLVRLLNASPHTPTEHPHSARRSFAAPSS